MGPLAEGLLTLAPGVRAAVVPHQGVVIDTPTSFAVVRGKGAIALVEALLAGPQDWQVLHRSHPDAPGIVDAWSARNLLVQVHPPRLAHLVTLGPDPRPVRTALHAAGMAAADAPTDSVHLTLVLADSLLDERVHEALATAPAAAVTAVLDLSGDRADIAILKGGCWTCLARRYRLNHPVRGLVAFPRRPDHLPTLSTVARVLDRAIRSPTPSGRMAGRLVRIGGTRVSHHTAARLPSCLACAPRGSADLRPADLLDPHLGIASDPVEADASSRVRVVHVRYRSPLVPTSLADLTAHSGGVATGRGQTLRHALESAIWEAAERTSGYWHPGRLHILASASDLGRAALLPHTTDLHSERQRDLADSQPQASSLLAVPPAFPHAARTAWVSARPLAAGGTRWVPAARVFYGYPAPFAAAHSNGCATGATRRDAAFRGLLELVERDAVALWWYTCSRRPALDPETLADDLRSLSEDLDRDGRSLHLLWLEHDIRTPVVAAVSRRRSGPPGWALGFGAALTPQAAALRAATEMVQLLAAPTNPLAWAETLQDAPWLVPDGVVTLDPAAAPPRPLDALVSRVMAVGVDPYVVDHTHPDVGVPAVRVLAPGLVHIWRHLGAERLYRVPLALGWHPHPLTESDMNPHDLTL